MKFQVGYSMAIEFKKKTMYIPWYVVLTRWDHFSVLFLAHILSFGAEIKFHPWDFFMYIPWFLVWMCYSFFLMGKINVFADNIYVEGHDILITVEYIYVNGKLETTARE